LLFLKGGIAGFISEKITASRESRGKGERNV